MRRFLLAALFCGLFFAVARSGWSAEAAAPPSEPPKYVGTESCKPCHEPSFGKFSHTMMGKFFRFNPRNETEKLACENCHGPAAHT